MSRRGPVQNLSIGDTDFAVTPLADDGVVGDQE